jgi:DNA polymerase-1
MSETPPRLFLIDAMGFIFRAFYAPMDRLRSPQGLPTKVPYLFATMLQKIIREWQPIYIAAVFDLPEPTFRDKLFAQYKAQRPAMPEDLSIQIPFVRRYIEAMRIPLLAEPGYEADDVIGTLARQASQVPLDTVIVTSDKDLLQLVGGPVRVLNPGKGDALIDPAKVEELMGVPPRLIPDIMALMGDSIDNIPGARDPNDKPPPGQRRKAGIGEVGARQLIAEFGSAEEALRRASEVKKSSYREALEKCGDFVRLSKQLATIPTDAPVSLDLDKLRTSEPDIGALRALYFELGFTSLLRDLPESPAESTGPKAVYEPIPSAQDLRTYLNSLKADEVAINLEPSPDDEEPGFGSRPIRIEISGGANSARFFELSAGANLFTPATVGAEAPAKPKKSAKKPTKKTAPESAATKSDDPLTILREWLGQKRPTKIVHDPKLLALLAAPHNLQPAWAGPQSALHSTMLYSFLLRPTTSKHALPGLAVRHLSAAPSGAPGENADFLIRLAPILRAEIERLELVEPYEKIDLPLAPVLARIERAGIQVDGSALDRFSRDVQKNLTALESRIFSLAGLEFNVNSPQQLAEVLFDKLGLALPRRTRAKPRSTSAEVLEELARVHELPRLVMEYREMAKLKSTYADALPPLISSGGRLHTRLSQAGAATGRLSSSHPNLQNIPVRTELGREIRAAFVAPKGHVLLSADYSQIELRLLAHFSQDPVLEAAFRNREDIHSRTAHEVFGIPPPLQTPDHRRVAKVINFGIVYGLSAFGLAQELSINQKEAARFIAAYFERYPDVKRYLETQIDEVRRAGFTRTLFGRIRPIPEINAPQPSLRGFAERTAVNTPLQGTAADIIKLAMIDIDRQLQEKNFQSRMILQIHDELLFEVPQDELPRLPKLVRHAMENVRPFQGDFRVPLLVEMKTGPNWRDMTPTS